jgi:hypothetical protein
MAITPTTKPTPAPIRTPTRSPPVNNPTMAPAHGTNQAADRFPSTVHKRAAAEARWRLRGFGA